MAQCHVSLMFGCECFLFLFKTIQCCNSFNNEPWTNPISCKPSTFTEHTFEFDRRGKGAADTKAEKIRRLLVNSFDTEETWCCLLLFFSWGFLRTQSCCYIFSKSQRFQLVIITALVASGWIDDDALCCGNSWAEMNLFPGRPCVFLFIYLFISFFATPCVNMNEGATLFLIM